MQSNSANGAAHATLVTAPASRGHKRLAAAVCVVFTMVTAALWPVAEHIHGPVPSFVAIYQSAIIVAYLMTAYLIFTHFRQTRTASLLWVGTGALYTGLVLVLQLLSFPNMLTTNRMVGAGPETTIWLWMFWHIGPPLFAIGYAGNERRRPGLQCAAGRSGLWIVGAMAGTAVLLGATYAAVTAALPFLPTVVRGDDYHELTTTGVGPAVELLTVIAMAVLWRATRGRTVIDLWLAVSLFTLILDNGLTMVGAARGSIGWTVGRLEALVSASLLLVVYMHEIGALYGRIAAALRELTEVNTALSTSRKTLEGSNRDLSAANDRLVAQSAELARTAEDLAAARTAAVAANEAKSRFLASMSHELRTPLTGIIGFAELLRDGGVPPEQWQRLLDLQRDAGHTLLAIVNDILDFSRVEAGKLELETVPFDLNALVSGCEAVVAQTAIAKGLTIRIHVEPTLPKRFVGDPIRLRQILLNLLSNAVKFTKTGGVDIDVSALSIASVARLRIAVTDSGIGIPADKLDRLFTDFMQVDNSITRRFGGSGLGLAISKRLVALMGGTIEVDSTVGRGSTFAFEIELPVASEPAMAVPSDPSVVRAPAGAPRHILLAEDVQANQLLIKLMLQSAGHTVDCAPDGAAALVAYRKTAYDLILMDMQMPVMSGPEATRHIRQAETAGTRVPIVALTANALASDVAECIAAGMDAHISKPIDRIELLRAVDRLSAKLSATTVPDADPKLAIFDPGKMDELVAQLGRPKALSLAATFRSQIASEHAALQHAPIDQSMVRNHVHVLVGVAGQIGCAALSDVCRQFMAAGNAESKTALVSAICEAVPDALKALDAWVIGSARHLPRLVAVGGKSM